MKILQLPRVRSLKVTLFMLPGIVFVYFLVYLGTEGNVTVGMCDTDIVAEINMDEEAVRAVLYQFDCGAMDSFSSQVSVLSAKDELPSAPGNVFSAKRGSRRGEWGGPYIEMEKADDGALEISYIEDAEVTQMKNESGGIAIRYKKIKVDVANSVEMGVLDEFILNEGISPVRNNPNVQ